MLLANLPTFTKLRELLILSTYMIRYLSKKIDSNKHDISFIGNFSKNIKKDNTVSKLFKVLEDKKILNNKKFQIKIKKNIPHEAGLGGGSMNTATILNFLIQKNLLRLIKKKLYKFQN